MKTFERAEMFLDSSCSQPSSKIRHEHQWQMAQIGDEKYHLGGKVDFDLNFQEWK